MTAEKKRIRDAFSAAAQTYDGVAAVQRRIARRLASHVPPSPAILDAGAGTGFLAACLRERLPEAVILHLDAALGMCRQGRQPVVCADLEALPLAPDCIDLYCSSLAWQWTRPAQAAQEAFRVLRPGGTLRVATLGPDTLQELRSAFRAVDDAPHVRSFDTPHIHQQALERAGFGQIRIERHLEQTHSEGLRQILHELRALGAHSLAQRRPGMLGRQAWLKLQATYETFRQPDGLPASYDVLILEAIKP